MNWKTTIPENDKVVLVALEKPAPQTVFFAGYWMKLAWFNGEWQNTEGQTPVYWTSIKEPEKK